MNYDDHTLHDMKARYQAAATAYEQAVAHCQVAKDRMHRARFFYVVGAACWTLGIVASLIVTVSAIT